jgi:hypothetical protein
MKGPTDSATDSGHEVLHTSFAIVLPFSLCYFVFRIVGTKSPAWTEFELLSYIRIEACDRGKPQILDAPEPQAAFPLSPPANAIMKALLDSRISVVELQTSRYPIRRGRLYVESQQSFRLKRWGYPLPRISGGRESEAQASLYDPLYEAPPM